MAIMQGENFKYAYFEDKFVDLAEAKVSIMTNALQYGTGIFAGIRGYYNPKKSFISIFRINDHYKRFLNALKILGVDFGYTQKEMVDLTVKLLQKNKPKVDVYFRPFAYSGNLKLSPNIDTKFEFALYMIPLGEYLPLDHGMDVKISSFRRINDNAIPSRAKISGGYVNSALAKKEATDAGYEDAIFLTHDGNVAEGSSMNIFIIRNNVLITPSKSDDILEGITRASIITLAKDFGFQVEERTVDRTELYVADEAFFCGTGAQVAWIHSIDKRIVGDGKIGKITKMLQERFFAIVKGNDDYYAKWCTKVPVKY